LAAASHMIENERRINIAISGGPCTGKTTLSALLTYRLKMAGFDYDSIGEEYRRLKNEFGQFENPAERCYMWMQQEREELRSNAKDGFITDTPLFHLYISARMYESTPKDRMIVRELWRRSLELDQRYAIIAMAENPREFKYVTDRVRSAGEVSSTKRHNLIRSYAEHHLPERLLLVRGLPEERTEQVIFRLSELRGESAGKVIRSSRSLDPSL
jgi:nicotinamide riboside kinase